MPLKNVAGLLFVALGDDPVSFDRAAAEVAEKMKHQGLEDAKLAKSVRYTVKANWKLVFENNRECYHCNTAHPEYVQGTYDTARFSPQTLRRSRAAGARSRASASRAWGLGDAMASSEMTGAYWRAARTPLMEGWKTQSLDGKPVAPLMGTFRARNEWSDGTLRSTDVPEFLAARERRPRGLDPHHADRCRRPAQVDVYWFVHKDAVEGTDYDLEKLMPFWQRTSEQDWDICEANQAGILSPRYEPGPYSQVRETNVQHFVDWYLGALGRRPARAALQGGR